MNEMNKLTGLGYSADFVAPILALMTLTAVVCIILYIHRLGYIKANRIHPDEFKTPEGKAKLQGPKNWAAENYNHLFEMPVLFYGVCMLFVITGKGDATALSLAWTYVSLRVLHSAIQIAYNKIMHRFLVFIISSAVMFALIIKAWLLIL